jgi:serine/threonine-protein kinase PknK
MTVRFDHRQPEAARPRDALLPGRARHDLDQRKSGWRKRGTAERLTFAPCRAPPHPGALCKNDTGMAQDRGGVGPFEVPGYRDVSQIGRGASSAVYKGYDPELSRWVAIKVLLTDDPDDPARKRFKREGEITANLGKHPHIVQVLGTGFTSSGSPYVVMELFEQGSIGDRLRASGAFTVEETLDIGEKIADAVSAAHRAGVLHRDIKPQNILLSEYGPALGDFGIARTSANLEWSQSLDQLTPMHAAPEVLLGGTSTVQSDLYALGSTLYAMLAGRPPFAGPASEAPLRYQVRVVQDPVPPIPRADLPPQVIEAIERALAKSPGDRYHSAADFRDALLSCQHHGAGAMAEATIAPHGPGAPTLVGDTMIPDDPPTAPEPASPALAHLAQRPPVVAPGPDTSDETVTRSGLGTSAPPGAAASSGHATVPGEPLTASTMFSGPPGLLGRADASNSAGLAAAGTPTSAAPVPAVPPPGVRAREQVSTGPPHGDEDAHTIQRPISTLDPPSSDHHANVNGGRRRRLLLLSTAVVVLVIVGVGALFLLGKPATPTLPIKKEYTYTTTDTDKPGGLVLVASANGAALEWSDTTGGRMEFLVYEISPVAGSKIVGVTPPGETTFSLPGIDPSSTQDCFEVRARIDTRTLGAPAQWCPRGESVSGS